MEMDELVIKIINHIDKTKEDINNALDQRFQAQKEEIIREVNVLMEQQQETMYKYTDAKFAIVEDRFVAMEDRFTNMEGRFSSLEDRFASLEDRFVSMEGRVNCIDKKIDQLAADQKDIKTKLTNLDQEFDNKIRRIK